MTAPSINGYEDKLHDTFAVPIKKRIDPADEGCP
jgi:hypothetical protein